MDLLQEHDRWRCVVISRRPTRHAFWTCPDSPSPDLGVTCIIQCGASMLITSALVHTDIHHSSIAPFPFVYPHVEQLPNPKALVNKSHRDVEKVETEKRGFKFWYGAAVRFIFEGTEMNVVLDATGVKSFFSRALWSFLQGV